MNSIQGLYLHFPFCKHLCNYCDFFKHKLDQNDQVTNFQILLSKQWNKNSELLKQQHFSLAALDSFYIGGGTPSLWGKGGAEFIKNLMYKGELRLATDCEFTMEVDPDAWQVEDLEMWQEVGVNRISIGAQSLNDKYLKILDRSHRKKDVEKTLNYFKQKNMNFSVDFLLGVPESKERDILNELNTAMEYGASHFSVYILKTRANYPHKLALPSDEETAEEYLKVCEFLNEQGYVQYEVSNFALPGKESEHNKKYWRYDSVAAIGPGATGLLVNEDKALRYQWKSSAAEYQTEELTGSSLIIEKLFLKFRTKSGISLDEIFLKSADRLKIDKLYLDWEMRGYLAPNSTRQRVILNSHGYLMSDSILDDLFKEIDF